MQILIDNIKISKNDKIYIEWIKYNKCHTNIQNSDILLQEGCKMAIRILLSRKLGELRWNQAQLARKTGIRPNTINELYHELVERVSLEQLDLICKALDCKLSDILVREDD